MKEGGKWMMIRWRQSQGEKSSTKPWRSIESLSGRGMLTEWMSDWSTSILLFIILKRGRSLCPSSSPAVFPWQTSARPSKGRAEASRGRREEATLSPFPMLARPVWPERRLAEWRRRIIGKMKRTLSIRPSLSAIKEARELVRNLLEEMAIR